MNVYKVDPIRDPRWFQFLQRHPLASVSHTPGWLEALRRTYGYEPVVLSTCPPTSELSNGLAFCRVDSWLTGHRMVSLPFSDHCEPLFDSAEELDFLIAYLQSGRHEEWKYVEVRPTNGSFGRKDEQTGFRPARKCLLHRLNLQPKLNELFLSLHKSSAQRRIRHAQRAGLIEKYGRSEVLLRDFYNLLVMTRGRHHLPPQPYDWLRNLNDCLGDTFALRLAYQGKTPVAAVLTLRFKDVVFYKYGCSDARYHHLGAIPLLLWRTIEDAKSSGAREFDMGRSDEDNCGLIAFKNHWARESTSLVYWRFPAPAVLVLSERWRLKMAKRIFACMPNALLIATGRLIYRHIG